MIGAMNQRITLERAVDTPDGIGGVTKTWVKFARDAMPWANVIAKSGKEVMAEGRTSASFVVLFTIYNRSDVTDLDRIIWGGVAYNIRGIRREGVEALRLVIEAERGVAS